MTLFFGLLLFPNFCSLFQMLHYHLTICLFSLICFLSFFVLLIPTPFIYLRLSQATLLAYSLTSFFAPGWVFLVFLHQILHLVWIFPISFLFVGLAREILHLITGDLFLNLWSSMEGSARWVQVLSIDKRLLIRKELTNFLLLSCFTQEHLRIQFLSFSIFIASCIMWKVIIFVHILLGVNLDHSSWTLENILFEFIRIFSHKDLFIFLNQIWLIQTSKSHLVLHWHRNFTVLNWILLFLFWSNLWKSWLLLWMTWTMTKILRNRWHRNRWNSMWSMNHASSNTLLMGVICSLFWRFSILGLVLEILEATVSISMGLSLHHLKCLFILVTLSMNWTSPYHHLLILMISLTLHILLVLHILIMIILLFLLHHHLHVLVKLVILWVHRSFLFLTLNFISSIDQMRFDSEIFFDLGFSFKGNTEWIYISGALNIVSWMRQVLLITRRILMSCLSSTLFR